MNAINMKARSELDTSQPGRTVDGYQVTWMDIDRVGGPIGHETVDRTQLFREFEQEQPLLMSFLNYWRSKMPHGNVRTAATVLALVLWQTFKQLHPQMRVVTEDALTCAVVQTSAATGLHRLQSEQCEAICGACHALQNHLGERELDEHLEAEVAAANGLFATLVLAIEWAIRLGDEVMAANHIQELERKIQNGKVNQD